MGTGEEGSKMFDRDLLNQIFESGDKEHLIFTHADKIWVMPECAVEGAMDMYQPVSRAGKCLKKTVVKKHKTPIFAMGSKVKSVKCSLESKVRAQLEEMLGISDFYVASYMGDTTTDQNEKVVLQIYNDNEIFAFVKVTDNSKVVEAFEREAKAINDLRNLGIENIPRVLGLKEIDGLTYFAQSNDKPMGQEVRLDFNEQVIQNIDKLAAKTKVSMSYGESEFSRSVEMLKSKLSIFDKEQQSILEEAIRQAEGASDFAFAHGDYTPWNAYYLKDEMYMFDMEYCSFSMPAYMDVFHYLSQISLLGKRYTAQCAMREYERYFELIGEHVSDPKYTYICYLVWIISFYIKRSEAEIERVREKLDVWVEMLEYLIKYL